MWSVRIQVLRARARVRSEDLSPVETMMNPHSGHGRGSGGAMHGIKAWPGSALPWPTKGAISPAKHRLPNLIRPRGKIDVSDDALPQFLLIDAQRLHSQFPDTFAVPSFDDIASLKSGDLVKIGVEFERDSGGHGGERFWVVVVAAFDKTSPACLRGRIDNDLVCTARHGLGLNDEIDFDPQHILAIQDRSDGPSPRSA